MAARNKRPTADAAAAPSPSSGASAAHSCGEEAFMDDCAEELAQSMLAMVGSREQPYTSDELLVRAAQLGEELKKAFLFSVRRGASRSRLRREKSHLDRILRGGALEELTRERAFVREVRRLALLEGPLPPDRPAATMVRDRDLDCDLVRPDAAATVFRHTGICVFEGALPEELLDECRTSFARTASQVDQALAARGMGSLSVTDFVTRAYAGHPIAFNEVCQRGTERLDIKLHALPQHCPGVSNGWEPQPMMNDPRLEICARWMPFVRAVLGEGAHECFRGVVDNRPGSTMQAWHADGVHASYADGARTPILICFDYRLVHRGSPNVHALGGPTRPILYIVYAREGCHDEQNFPTDRPLF
eukprot:jgi/Chrpa1/11515/Chrysochromulina_OHIO_Genome00017320-RA